LDRRAGQRAKRNLRPGPAEQHLADCAAEQELVQLAAFQRGGEIQGTRQDCCHSGADPRLIEAWRQATGNDLAILMDDGGSLNIGRIADQRFQHAVHMDVAHSDPL